MGPEENKAVVRRFVEEIPNNKNSVPADELLTSGFVLHFPNMPPVEGIEAFKEIPTAILSAFPDLVETIDDLVAEGDRVIERMTLRGTHLGEFMGLAPTGKPVSWTAIAIYRREEGRIAECWVEPNLLGLALQTGVVSLPRGLLATGDQGPRLDCSRMRRGRLEQRLTGQRGGWKSRSMPEVPVNGVRLYYEEHGQGDPILCIHG